MDEGCEVVPRLIWDSEVFRSFITMVSKLDWESKEEAD